MLRYDLSDPTRSALLRHGLQGEGGLDIMERELRASLEQEGFLLPRKVTDNLAARRAKGALDYVTSGAYLKSHREFLLSAGEIYVARYMDEGLRLEQAAA